MIFNRFSSRFSRKILLASGIIILLIIVAGFSAFFYWHFYSAPESKNIDFSSSEQIQKTVDSVAKIMVLPTDELPSLAIVEEADKLNDQPFFSQAQNGDQLLVYSEAKKAILYRPASHQIVEVIPLAATNEIIDLE